jgi:hypothetical protein
VIPVVERSQVVRERPAGDAATVYYLVKKTAAFVRSLADAVKAGG